MTWKLASTVIRRQRFPVINFPLINTRGLSTSHKLQSIHSIKPKACIVGSGPAGFYTAQSLLKGHGSMEIDIYEKLPVPFGLVRYGVAPDHPETKNVIHTFTNIAKHERVQFLGNVNIGSDVTLEQLRKAYNIVILAYGAAQDRWLGIPGESLPNVVSARRFVGWYNGLPEDTDLKVDFDVETAVIIGQGNVALDVARILLTPINLLKKTDITSYAVEALSKSRIRNVKIVGRRGPLQVAFTIKELREMVNLPEARPLIHLEDFAPIESVVPSLPRPRKRLTELMLQAAKSSKDPNAKEWELKFCRSPLKINESAGNPGRISSVTFAINRLENELSDNPKVVTTDDKEDLECGLVFRSIGYKSVPLSDELPFDSAKGTIKQKMGRVEGMPGVYCSGWVASGPVGVIGSTLQSGLDVAKVILEDTATTKESPFVEEKKGREEIFAILEKRGVKPVSFDQWEKLDGEEVQRGEKSQKPREKVADVNEMLDIVHKKH